MQQNGLSLRKYPHHFHELPVSHIALDHYLPMRGSHLQSMQRTQRKRNGEDMAKLNKKDAGVERSKKNVINQEEVDYSLNDVLLRGRVSAPAISKELPSGDKVVEFRLIVSRDQRQGVDTLDIAAWSAKARKCALSLHADEWVEIAGSIHRRFWQGPAGLSSRWQISAAEIVRL